MGNLLWKLLHVYLMCTQFARMLKQHLRLCLLQESRRRERDSSEFESGNRITDLLNKFRCKTNWFTKCLRRVGSSFLDEIFFRLFGVVRQLSVWENWKALKPPQFSKPFDHYNLIFISLKFISTNYSTSSLKIINFVSFTFISPSTTKNYFPFECIPNKTFF